MIKHSLGRLTSDSAQATPPFSYNGLFQEIDNIRRTLRDEKMQQNQQLTRELATEIRTMMEQTKREREEIQLVLAEMKRQKDELKAKHEEIKQLEATLKSEMERYKQWMKEAVENCPLCHAKEPDLTTFIVTDYRPSTSTSLVPTSCK